MKKVLFLLLAFLVLSCNGQWYAKKLLLTQGTQFTHVNYGLIYNGYAVLDSRNICSVGWHIPTLTQTNTLAKYLGGVGVAGGKLKEIGTIWWNSPNTGATNEVGFNFRGGGYRNMSGGFVSFKSLSSFWTSTIYNTINLYNRTTSNTSAVLSSGANAFVLGTYIRPIKDSTTLTHGQTGTYTDPSGFIYPTICVGTQEWVACNIRTINYRNGDFIHGFEGGTYTPIPNADWAALTTEGCCVYNDDLSNK